MSSRPLHPYPDVEPPDPETRIEQQLVDQLTDRGFRVAVQCRRCHQWLTNPISVARHVGPKCRAKEAAA